MMVCEEAIYRMCEDCFVIPRARFQKHPFFPGRAYEDEPWYRAPNDLRSDRHWRRVSSKPYS